MTAAVPGPAHEATRSASAHAAPAADATTDALIAALFDAALEQAMGEIDAGRLPVGPAAEGALPVPVAVEALRDRNPDEPPATEAPGTADPWLAIAAWRQDAVPLAAPAVTVPAAPATPTGDASLPADSQAARPTVDLLAIRPDTRRDTPGADPATPPTTRGRDMQEARTEPTYTPLPGTESDLAKPLPSAATPTAPAPAAHDERRATRPQDAALSPSMALSPAAWLATPAPAPVAAPIDAAAFAPALAEQVVRLLHLKMDRVELAVHPAELGPVELKVTMTGADANVVVIAVHPEARAALEQSLPDLRSLLQGAGITLGEASVRDGRSSRDDARSSGTGPRETPRDEAAADVPIAVVRRRGLVDLYA